MIAVLAAAVVPAVTQYANKGNGPASAAITTGSIGGGQFTGSGLLFTIGRKIALTAGWLTVPILNPVTCAEILAMNKSIDNTPSGANNAGTDGIVIWGGTCTAAVPTGTVTTRTLRLAPAN